MDAYKILLWTTDPLLVLAVGAAFGALIGFGATFAVLLGPHTRAAQACREAAFLKANQSASGSLNLPSTSRMTCRYTRKRVESGSDLAINKRSWPTTIALCSGRAAVITSPMTAESAATASLESNSSVFTIASVERDHPHAHSVACEAANSTRSTHERSAKNTREQAMERAR